MASSGLPDPAISVLPQSPEEEAAHAFANAQHLAQQEKQKQDDKIARLNLALDQHDLPALVAAARDPAGFVNDAIRRRACECPPCQSAKQPIINTSCKTGPQLLGCANHPSQDISLLPPHRDEGQVKLDVDRSFVYYPTGKSRLRPLCFLPTDHLRN